jgi:hypothetical protein
MGAPLRIAFPSAALAVLLLTMTPLAAQEPLGGEVPQGEGVTGSDAAGGDLLPPAEGEFAVTPEGGDLLPPPEGGMAVAPEGGDLLPPAEGGLAVAPESGDLLPPPAEGDLAATDPAGAVEEEIVVIDPNAPQTPPALPEGMVRVVLQNVTAAPVDVFLDAMDGSDPIWVMTLGGGFEVVQPSLVGQTWRLAQNDEWMGGFVPTAEPTQIIRFSGQKP